MDLVFFRNEISLTQKLQTAAIFKGCDGNLFVVVYSSTYMLEYVSEIKFTSSFQLAFAHKQIQIASYIRTET